MAERWRVTERGGRRRWLLALGAIVATAAVALAVRATLEDPLRRTPAAARSSSGLGPAPELVLEGLRDRHVSISLPGSDRTPLVVNFWAAWCAPCRKEMPAVQAVYADVKGRVRFVGVDNQDIRGDGLDLVHETHVRYPLASDPTGDAARAFGILGMPTTILVSADGEMLERVNGAMTERDLRATIRRLFDV